MRVAAVIHRYGSEIHGGSEALCRSLMMRLIDRGVSVEVFTTCALDHLTWANDLPRGLSVDQGVAVRRFRTITRRSKLFPVVHRRVLGKRHSSRRLQERWMRAQGPRSPSLVRAVKKAAEEVDLVLVFTYLYYPTYFTLRGGLRNAVLHPTAHDEPPLYFSMFREMFKEPAGLIFLSPEELDLVVNEFDVGDTPHIVLGAGVEPPARASSARFQNEFGIDGPYVLCLGRQEGGKGTQYLSEWFMTYKRRHPGDLKLVLAGSGDYRPPPDSSIVSVGPLSEEMKWDALKGAEALIQPSFFESFSLVLLEAWAMGTPAIVNGWCRVTKGHSARSGAGVWYHSYAEFEAALNTLLRDPHLGRQLGANGQEYVHTHYRWDTIMDRYISFLSERSDACS